MIMPQPICLNRCREKSNQVKRSQRKEMSFINREELEFNHSAIAFPPPRNIPPVNYNFPEKTLHLNSPESLGLGEVQAVFTCGELNTSSSRSS